MADSSLVTLPIRPGLLTEATQRDAENRWYSGLNVRFRRGMPEKLGGWSDAAPGEVAAGVPRQLHDWTALDDTVFTAVGTATHLYVYSNGTFTDITPVDTSGQLTNPFDTTSGSAIVNVSDVSHGRSLNDRVIFENATAVGGITIDGEYTVTEVVDNDNFTITHSSAATSTANGGGTVDYTYLLPVGNSAVTVVGGYGTGKYGQGGYGEPSESGLTQEPRIWCFDNWGEDLIAGVRGGNIYVWDRSVGLVDNRATLIANAPTEISWLLVSDNRQIIALGANGDPLLIAWCDEEDYTTWTAASTNAAGDLRLNRGSRIVTARHGRSEKLVWTDNSLHAFQPRNAPFYWGLSAAGQSVRIAGPNAAAMVEGVAYFMGIEDFHVYDGVLRVLPCDIRNEVFGNIDRSLMSHVFACVNSDFTEIWWCYPRAGSTENDRVAVYNYAENHWTLYAMERTCMHDSSAQFGRPYGMGATTGKLYRHETGYNDDDAEMTGHLESYFAEIAEGDQFVRVDRAVPDFLQLAGDVDLTLKARRYAQDANPRTKGPFTISGTTEKVDVLARGRQTAVRIEFDGLNTYFRMGHWKLRIMPDGEM